MCTYITEYIPYTQFIVFTKFTHHAPQERLPTCRVCNLLWFPVNRVLQKKCVKEKHKLYTCITGFTESTEFPIRECCPCESWRWRTRKVGWGRPPQRLTLG